MKEITLPVQVLKEALPGLNKIVAKKTTLPVLSCVRVARDSGGQVHIQATDLDAFATYTATEPSNGPVVDLLVPLESVAKTIKILSADSNISFVVEAEDKVKLRYTVGGSIVERSISTCAIEEFPSQPTITQPAIQLEPGFGVALRQALQCCSDDSSRVILNSACLDVSDKKLHYVVGTNGRCLYSANSFCFDLKNPVVIPDSKFLEWTDFLDDEPASLTVQPAPTEVKGKKLPTPSGPAWLKLQSGRWSFITKEVEGIYPNWKQCVPNVNSNWTSVQFSDEAIKQLLLVVPNLPGNDDENHTVKISVTGDRVMFEGRNRDEDTWTGIPVQEVKITGKPVTVGLNRYYLLNALRFGLNQLHVEDALTPVVLSNGGKKLVIMPVRLEGPKTVKKTQPTSPTATAAVTPTTQTTSPADTGTQTERTEMPRGVRTAAMNAVPTIVQHHNGNGSTNGQETSTGSGSTVKSLVEHIDQIKENLKAVLRDLNEVSDALKLAEKEKRTTEKEIESVRNKLLQIQRVTI